MIVDRKSCKFNMLCKSGLVDTPENCERLREIPLELVLSARDLPFLVFNQFESRSSVLSSSVSVEWWSVKGALFLSFFLNPEHLSKILIAGGTEVKSRQSTQCVEVAVGNGTSQNLFLVSLARHKLVSDSSKELLWLFDR